MARIISGSAIAVDLGRRTAKRVRALEARGVSPTLAAVTPVHGGVGPLIGACLLQNTARTVENADASM